MIREIDGLRFVCISSVFLFHVNLYLWMKVYHQPVEALGFVSRLLAQGAWGVELFFLISGFVVSLPFARHALLDAPKPSIRRYFFRRVTRLEPPYILNLLLCFALVVAVKHVAASTLLPNLLASLGYSHAFLFQAPSAVNDVAWSLEVEIQFYVLAPLFARVFFIRRTAVRRGVLLAGAVLALTFPYTLRPLMNAKLFDLSLLHYLAFFAMGMIVVDLYLVDWKSAPKGSVAWDILGVAAAVAAAWACLADAQPATVMPFLFLVMACATFRGRATSALLSTPLLTVIGGMCYTIYLYHGLVISFAGRFFGSFATLPFDAGLFLATAITGLLTLVLGGVLFVTVERPCMDPTWPSKLAAFVANRVPRRASSSPRSHG